MISDLWGLLTVVFLGLALVFATLAAVHVMRLQGRPATAIGDEIGSAKAITRKVRKGEPMSQDELTTRRNSSGAVARR